MGKKIPIIKWLLTTTSFSIFQFIVLTKTLPYEQFELDISLKVMAAIFNMDLADLNGGTHLPQACYQAVLGVLFFAYVGSTNIHLVTSYILSSWPSGRSPEVKMSPIGKHVNLVISSKNVALRTYRVCMWYVDNMGGCHLLNIKLGHNGLVYWCYRAKFTFPMYSNEQDVLITWWLFTTVPSSKCQMIVFTVTGKKMCILVPAATFVSYNWFDLYIFFKVTEYWQKCKITLLKCWIKL